jgi:hypothetical protein
MLQENETKAKPNIQGTPRTMPVSKKALCICSFSSTLSLKKKTPFPFWSSITK